MAASLLLTTAAKLLSAAAVRPPIVAALRPLSSYPSYGYSSSDIEAWNEARRGVVRHDEDRTSIRVDMPGFSKQDVKAWVEGHNLIVDGCNEPLGCRRCRVFVPLDEEASYNFDELNITVACGVVKVVIPKFSKKY